MDKAVVLASGGVNSTVAVALTREQYTPYLLHVNWGHRSAEREAIAFQQTASAMGIENTMLVEIDRTSVMLAAKFLPSSKTEPDERIAAAKALLMLQKDRKLLVAEIMTAA